MRTKTLLGWLHESCEIHLRVEASEAPPSDADSGITTQFGNGLRAYVIRRLPEHSSFELIVRLADDDGKRTSLFFSSEKSKWYLLTPSGWISFPQGCREIDRKLATYVSDISEYVVDTEPCLDCFV